MESIWIIVGVVVGAIVGGFVAYFAAHARAKAIVHKAEADGEMIKKEKMLQAKEKFIQLKSDHDRQVNERNQKLQQSEQRAKQIESNLQNKERELERKSAECDKRKEQLDNQLKGVEARKEELAAAIKAQNERLEQISGMSSEEAKNTLVENMKNEAKAEAAAFVSETIEEAKLTATKEAKRIVKGMNGDSDLRKRREQTLNAVRQSDRRSGIHQDHGGGRHQQNDAHRHRNGADDALRRNGKGTKLPEDRRSVAPEYVDKRRE